ncbi:hypothetical protein [Ligilactobacillus apodemi]|uniref:hypothetical protein n=1 Tax=Ligilactobacillus apodemi TaxID=307126 RepID=UPI00214AB18D|nr:hypothetical protein [Ligilactobacillus apodemi]MCR1901615.1 hypothetical protein [Ligilactobacillus apodemi]
MSFSVETVSAAQKAFEAIPAGTSKVLTVPDVDQSELFEVLQKMHAKLPDTFETPEYCFDGQVNVLVHKH